MEGEVKTLHKVGQYSQGYFQLTVDSSNAQNYTSNLSDTTNVKVNILFVNFLLKLFPFHFLDMDLQSRAISSNCHQGVADEYY